MIARTLLDDSLSTDEWKKNFRGRDILKHFTGDFCRGIRYEMFRDLIISVMVNDGYQPDGMKSVIQGIMDD